MGSQRGSLSFVCQLQIPCTHAGCAWFESGTKNLADFTVTDHPDVFKLHAHVSD
jgi:hypothetical protein